MKINLTKLLTSIVILLFGLLIINQCWNWHQEVNKAINKECIGCTIWEKNCPYTDKELLDQEYVPGPCSDMGTYEMLWKLSFAGMFIGIVPIAVSISVFYQELRQKKIKRKQTKHG